MNICIETPALADASHTLSEHQIRSLARTYDRVADPIRVEDTSGSCLYQNRPAARRGSGLDAHVTFDIIDHANRVVAHLHTCRR